MLLSQHHNDLYPDDRHERQTTDPSGGLEFDSGQYSRQRNQHAQYTPVANTDSIDYDNGGYGQEKHGTQVHEVPLGLRPLTYTLLVAVITALVVGAVLGGALGSQIKSSSPQA